MLVDSHCHLNIFSESEKQSCISQCLKEVILIDSSIDYQSSVQSLELSSTCPFVYSSLGFHPFSGKTFNPQIIEEYRVLIRENKKIVAIGEIGLDSKADISLKEQEVVLRAFLSIAISMDLPVIIHNRLASFQAVEVLDEFFTSYEKVIFHCFSYSPEFLQEIIKRKGNVSFSLNILRRKPEINLSLKACPLNSLLLETDSPYMRIDGKQSSPLDISRVYTAAAAIKNIDEERLKAEVFTNVKRIFSINESGKISE